MDESWRCTMGSVLPRQRSSDHHAGGGGGWQSLAPDDFRDVFGGPPRTVLLRSFYGEAESYHSPAMGQKHHVSYGGSNVFCRRQYLCVVVDGGGAAATAVPTEEGFFGDISGLGRHVRSRSRSTKSSSVVSSDEFGAVTAFCRQAASGCRSGDATLSSVSKLRPIEIPSRRYDSSPPSTVSTRGDYQSSFTCSTAAYTASRCYYAGRTATNHSNDAGESSASHHNYHQHHLGSGGFCCFTSNPETTSNRHSFRRTRAGRTARSPVADADTAIESWSHADYVYYYSPPSATSSSVFWNPLPRTPRRLEEVVMEVRERAPLLMDDDGDIYSVGGAAVDEAIAWAKERFWSQA